MITVLILLVILVVILSLLKKKPTVPTTTVEPTTTAVPTTTDLPTTTENPIEFWYILHKCDDQNIFRVGPFTGSPQFSTGEKVEGATGVFYVVASKSDHEPGYPAITGITFTGKMGC